MRKSADAFRTISEVSAWLDAPTHVLRFWESKFPQVKPVKRAGGRRYYRPEDMLLLGGIKQLLHNDGITIKGVQKILKEQGVKHVSSLSPEIGDGGKKPRVKKPTTEKPTDTPTKAPVETQAETQAAPAVTPLTETPLEPLQLTPSDASDAPTPITPDTRVNQGTYASEDTPWAKPVDPSAPPPAQASSEPAAPADPEPTGEYVRRFGFVADGADTAQDDTPIDAPTEAELGHLRPGPVAHLRYRNRDGAPIYPHRSYAPATLAAIQSVSDKLRSLGQSF